MEFFADCQARVSERSRAAGPFLGAVLLVAAGIWSFRDQGLQSLLEWNGSIVLKQPPSKRTARAGNETKLRGPLPPPGPTVVQPLQQQVSRHPEPGPLAPAASRAGSTAPAVTVASSSVTSHGLAGRKPPVTHGLGVRKPPADSFVIPPLVAMQITEKPLRVPPQPPSNLDEARPLVRGRQEGAAVIGQPEERGAASRRSAAWQPGPPRGQKPMIFVHIHKAAGSWMCGMAQMQRERVVQPQGNCNWKPGDMYPDGEHPEKARSCQQRVDYFKGRFTYGQLEREIWPSDRCFEHFAYGTLLRDPVDLVHSHMNFAYALFHGATKPQLIAEVRRRIVERREESYGISQYKFFDNIQTRILAGAVSECAGCINHTHIETAKWVLSYFSAVARVQDMTDARLRREFFQRMGWQDRALPHNNVMKKDAWDFTTEEVEWLKEVNKADYELYDWIPPR